MWKRLDAATHSLPLVILRRKIKANNPEKKRQQSTRKATFYIVWCCFFLVFVKIKAHYISCCAYYYHHYVLQVHVHSCTSCNLGHLGFVLISFGIHPLWYTSSVGLTLVPRKPKQPKVIHKSAHNGVMKDRYCPHKYPYLLDSWFLSTHHRIRLEAVYSYLLKIANFSKSPFVNAIPDWHNYQVQQIDKEDRCCIP